MAKVINFSENFEKDLGRLGEKISEKKESEPVKELPEKGIVKESIRAVSSDVETQSAAPAPINIGEEDNVLPQYIKDESAPEAKKTVRKLIDSAFKNGLIQSLKEAKKHPPFVEDAFHDALVDKLLPELKKRGMLK